MAEDHSELLKKYLFLQRLTRLCCVEHMWLFGSRARNDHQERADIDIAIDCPKATDAEWFEILDIVEDADTLLSIDCVRFDSLDRGSPLRQAIEHEGVLLYGRCEN